MKYLRQANRGAENLGWRKGEARILGDTFFGIGLSYHRYCTCRRLPCVEAQLLPHQ